MPQSSLTCLLAGELTAPRNSSRGPVVPHWRRYRELCASAPPQGPYAASRAVYKFKGLQSDQALARQVHCLASASEDHNKVPPWQRIVVFVGGAMLMASLHRVAFSVLAVPFAEEFNLNTVHMGLLQSSILVGYVFGQVPAGFVADRIGGPNVMLAGLALWSCFTGLMPLARAAPPSQQLLVLMLLRALLGLSQSVILPSTSAAVSRRVPNAYRSRALTGIHAAYNAGNVTALSCTPLLISSVGWPWCLRAYSAMGLLWAAASANLVFAQPPRGPAEQQQSTAKLQEPQAPRQGMRRQVVMLCFVHIIISWAFFIFQAWMPTYLKACGITDLQKIGSLSAIPWIGAAAVGVLAGFAADWLHAACHWPWIRVRLLMQLVASLGPAASLLPLVVLSKVTPRMAVMCLTAAVALQAFCYSGFHAYVQDVAPRDAGKLLGLTNTCGTAAGVVANLSTGRLAAGPGGYAWVFGSCIALYVLSAICWLAFAHGQTISLPAPASAT